MEEKSGKRPLRTSSNTAKDIQDTYLKNEGKRMNKPLETETIEEMEMAENEAKTDNDLLNEIESSGNDDEQNTVEDNLKAQIEILDKEKQELKDQLIRKAAEFENYRKRSLREKSELLEFGNEKLLFKMLELLDDINNALDASQKTNDFNSLLAGLKLIKSKADKLFSESGVKQMEDPKGEEFDVDYHEAMMHVQDNDVPEGYVIQVIQHGYMLNEKVLRHAKVVTSAGSSNS